MKPIVRTVFLGLTLVLLASGAALAADTADAAPDAAPPAVSHHEAAMTLLSPESPEADPLSAWLEPPEWTSEELAVEAESCVGWPNPPLSCTCWSCCRCHKCWEGFNLALCDYEL